MHALLLPIMVLACLYSSGNLHAQAQLTLTLTPSDYNGYNIRCFGGKSGSIDLTVTGGTAPYTFHWTSRDTIEDLLSIPAGYYQVTVLDANLLTADASITLTEPEALKVLAVPYRYPEGTNISCNQCYNGSIEVTVTEGVPSYTYAWGDGVTTQNRSGLGAQNYNVKVTDANGCIQKSEPIFLKQPDSDDWKMGGNIDTDPNSQYIGTLDSTDLSFRTNERERLRIGADGTLRSKSLSFDSGYSLLMADSTGAIMKIGSNDYLTYIQEPKPGCPIGASWPWLMCGNHVRPGHVLGSTNDAPLHFMTNNVNRMVITADGKVGIGTGPPNGPIVDYTLFVENGIVCRDVLVKLGAWPDYVFESEYDLMPLAELREFLFKEKHLPGIPSAAEVAAKGGLEVGKMQTDLLRVVEEQAIYILQLEERLGLMEKRLGDVEQLVKP
ncbi:MAG: SprB repeat-containing protein [Flavobacteriales bacterium]|nr:SprB repeat-containing protein [Flavobacteriales bacterium]MBP9139896.1 SprB repeat-containing protein [Flavobacteriales bacterium]HQX31480.1 SprB repeat-containing protein [Flavobacteriales bacterium]